MQISLILLHAVSASLVQRGLAAEQLAEVGLGSALPRGPGMLPWADAADRIERGCALSREDGIALLVGEHVSVRVLQAVGLAVLNAKTMREAMTTFCRFATLVVVGAHFELAEAGDRARFVFDPPPCSPDATRLSVEFTLSVVSRIAVDLLQHEKRIRLLHLRHADPGYSDVYRRVFGCEPHFSQGENALGLSRYVLDKPLAGGDDAVRSVLVQRAEEALSVQQHSTKVAVRVSQLLRDAELDSIDLRSVARTLALSTTVLRRRLRLEGTTWSHLVDEARRERALQALVDPNMTIKELSLHLGFSEPRAFHRAFRRWTNTTPSEYRSNLAKRPTMA